MKQFKCDSCGKEFDRKKNLLYHINNKVCDDKKYDCRYCENKFSTKTSMYRHMKHVCKTKKDNIVYMENDKPYIYGVENDKVLDWNGSNFDESPFSNSNFS